MDVSTKCKGGLSVMIHVAGKAGCKSLPARKDTEKWNAPFKYLPDQTTIADLCTSVIRHQAIDL